MGCYGEWCPEDVAWGVRNLMVNTSFYRQIGLKRYSRGNSVLKVAYVVIHGEILGERIGQFQWVKISHIPSSFPEVGGKNTAKRGCFRTSQ